MGKDFCRKCGKCCKNIKIDTKNKILFFDGIQHLEESFFKMLDIISQNDNISYCKCKFLQDDLCTNPVKPEICKNYPSSPFSFIPDNCGFEGEIFVSQEQIKQKVRKIKEEIIHYEAIIVQSKSKSEKERFSKIIESLKKNVKRYADYGSEDW